MTALRTRTRALGGIVASLLGLAACTVTGPAGAVDAGPASGDAGLSRGDAWALPDDAGPIADAGAIADAGPIADAGAIADAGPIAEASVEERAGVACDPDDAAPRGSRCIVLTVSCGGLDPMEVELRDSPPTLGEGAGVVVLGSGGNGQRWSAGYRGVVSALRADGYRVLERRWRGDGVAGWLAGGMGPGACRYAALARWIDENLRGAGEPLCVSGNSGGSGEIGAALVRHGLDAVVTAAVLTSGPMARVDYACGREDEWAPLCDGLVEGRAWTCAAGAPSCGTLRPGERALFDAALAPEPSACSEPTDAHLMLLEETSPLASTADTDLDTDVRLLLGSEDCSIAPAHGLHFASLVRARGLPLPVEIVPGAPHELPGSPEGEVALLAALRASCR